MSVLPPSVVSQNSPSGSMSKDKMMIWYLRLRGPTTAKAYEQLKSALADFDDSADVYAAKRGRFNWT